MPAAKTDDNNIRVSIPETEGDEDYGLYYFPNRMANPVGSDMDKATWKTAITDIAHRKANNHAKCSSNVTWCTQNHFMVKVMLGALRKHGCPVNMRRHISCEDCRGSVNGGYDPVNNQVVVCQTRSRKRTLICGVLTHELIHMFDHCRAKLDILRNVEHLACTEIRAANLNHCSLMSALGESYAGPLSYPGKHHECVRIKALMSVLSVRNVSTSEALAVVNRVFDRCYNDLEPFGRRPRQKGISQKLIAHEAYLFGYLDKTW